MAGKPDLVGKVIALRKDEDSDPPWVVQCVVTNQGTGPSGAFKVRLTIWDEASFTAKPFWWCTRTIEVKAFGGKFPPGLFATTEFGLPPGFKHTDFGPKHPY